MFSRTLSLVLTVITISSISNFNMSPEEIDQTVNEKIISCGSSIRIQNEITKFYLSSFDMHWSSGSRGQIITAVEKDSQYESLFIIKEQHDAPPCENGTPIACDSIIRLEHVTTGRNLHSHTYKSFITNSQEACAFGENGEGDVNDNFQIICYKWDQPVVKGQTSFFLLHVATQKYLYIDYKRAQFNDSNCRGCPINGQKGSRFD